MDLSGREGSSNVEDRRGSRAGRGLALGGGGTLVLLVVSYLMGANPLQLLSLLSENGEAPVEQGPAAPPADAASNPQVRLVSIVLRDTEETWPPLLAEKRVQYVPPKLVLFSGAVESACGSQTSAAGPFYCSSDQRVYIDLGFYRELDQRFGAPGDFAQAYVIAHEVGHHVQNLLGTSSRVQALRRRAGEAESNRLSVGLELQADCYAGVWGHHARSERKLLEPGDVEEGLRAAAAVGDDTLQQRSRGVVVRESFTHGSSAQRAAWFRRGFESGRIESCDTFDGR